MDVDYETIFKISYADRTVEYIYCEDEELMTKDQMKEVYAAFVLCLEGKAKLSTYDSADNEQATETIKSFFEEFVKLF